MTPEEYWALSVHERQYVTTEVLRRLGLLDELRQYRDLTDEEIAQIRPIDHEPNCEHYR